MKTRADRKGIRRRRKHFYHQSKEQTWGSTAQKHLPLCIGPWGIAPPTVHPVNHPQLWWMENMHKYIFSFPKCVQQSRLCGRRCIRRHFKTEARPQTLVWYAYLDIPVFVEIVNAGDAAAVPVGVVNMADVPGAVAGVTGNHSLETQETRRQLAFLWNKKKML